MQQTLTLHALTAAACIWLTWLQLVQTGLLTRPRGISHGERKLWIGVPSHKLACRERYRGPTLPNIPS